jgi:hypothetical protein
MKAKAKIYGCTLFAMLLARLMQLAAKRMGNEGHTFGAEAISLLLAIGYTSVSAR